MKLNRSMFSLCGNLAKNTLLASLRTGLGTVKSVLAGEGLYNSIGCTEKLQIRYANLRV